MFTRLNTEVLIVGSGISGLLCAIELAKSNKVLILSKSHTSDCSTSWAQGGIAAAINDQDDVKKHAEDTILNGHYICDNESVLKIIKQGKDSIDLLIKYGVEFNKNGEKLKQTLEGGHSKRRIAYHNDNTGEEIHTSLLKKAKSNKNITIKENIMAIDLIGDKDKHCEGLYAYDDISQSVITVQANITILATGGASKIYQYTTNPDTSTGDGVALAYRFGCTISNMEFIQFHPTCLYHSEEKSFLISESLRGEGAKLVNPDGEYFMNKYDIRGELAPRDVVARAIDIEMKNNSYKCVYLDISFKDRSYILKRFPNIYKKCLKLGIDISKSTIPVVPAAHYTCGGIRTNVSGETDCSNLFAIGEVAHTGLHGANRLASNSLLECSVMAMECCKMINKKNIPSSEKVLPLWNDSYVTEGCDENILISHNWAELRKIMWNYVGILRTDKMLNRAKEKLSVINSEINEFYHTHKISKDLLELRNIIDVANIITDAAIIRKESRGLHYNKDYPVTKDEFNKPTELKNTKKDFIMKLVSKA
jgi:L-aspartate oxidase